IGLAHVDAVVLFRKRPVAAVTPKRNIRRTITLARFQSDAKKPIICQRAAKTDAEPVALTMAFQPVIWVRKIITRCPSAAIFITHTRITVELDLVNRRREFP